MEISDGKIVYQIDQVLIENEEEFIKKIKLCRAPVAESKPFNVVNQYDTITTKTYK